MSARRDERYGHWFYRKQIRLLDGRVVRIFGVPTTIGLPDSKPGAEQAERLHLDRVLETGEVTQTPQAPKEAPKVRDFVELSRGIAAAEQAVICRREGMDASSAHRAGYR